MLAMVGLGRDRSLLLRRVRTAPRYAGYARFSVTLVSAVSCTDGTFHPSSISSSTLSISHLTNLPPLLDHHRHRLVPSPFSPILIPITTHHSPLTTHHSPRAIDQSPPSSPIILHVQSPCPISHLPPHYLGSTLRRLRDGITVLALVLDGILQGDACYNDHRT